MNPRARTHGLTVKETADGLDVYNADGELTHTLHPLTSFVWKHADGLTSVSELAVMAREQIGVEANLELVWSALDALADAQMLETRVTPPSAPRRIGRRALITRVVAPGMVAGLAASVAFRGTASAEDPQQQEENEKRQQENQEQREKKKAAKEEDQKANQEQRAKEQEQTQKVNQEQKAKQEAQAQEKKAKAQEQKEKAQEEKAKEEARAQEQKAKQEAQAQEKKAKAQQASQEQKAKAQEEKVKQQG